MLHAALAFFVTLSLALLVRLCFAYKDLFEIKRIVGIHAVRYPDLDDKRYAPSVRDMRADMQRIEEILQ